MAATHIGNFDCDYQIPQRCSYGKVLCIFYATGDSTFYSYSRLGYRVTQRQTQSVLGRGLSGLQINTCIAIAMCISK